MSMMMQAIQNKKGRLSEWERACLGQTLKEMIYLLVSLWSRSGSLNLTLTISTFWLEACVKQTLLSQ